MCNDGFIMSAEHTECILCPRGSHCKNNTAYACGVNATTVGAGANTHLQCVPTNIAENGVGMLAVVDFTLLTPSDDVQQCPALAWLQYGMLIGCRVQIRDINTGLQRSLLCSIVTSKIAAASYAVWLMQQLQDKAAFTAAALRACLNVPQLIITQQGVTGQSVQSMLKTYYFFDPSSDVLQIDGPLAPPKLRYEPLRWGQQPQDTVAVMAAMGILGTALPLSLAILVAALWARRRQRMHLQAVISKVLEHRLKLMPNEEPAQT
jgi:hypothetical protein